MSRLFADNKQTKLPKRAGSPLLHLITSEWMPVGKLADFPLQQPKVVLLQKQGFAPKAAQWPLYVLQRGYRKFVVVDLHTFGQYDYRVQGESIYVRRLLQATS